MGTGRIHRHSSRRPFPDRTFSVPTPSRRSEVAEAPLQLLVLGPTELTGAGEGVSAALIRQPKRLALLAYLALATADGYRRRDSIVGMFWPELDQMHGRQQFRKALHALRKALGPGAVGLRGEEEVRLEPQVWCDAVAFRRHVEAGTWGEALALYRGDLLDGLFPGGVGQEFEDWLGEQRRLLRLCAAQAAWECSAREDLAGRRAEALMLARRAVEFDPEGEESVRRYIALLDRHGDRAAALRVFAEWERRLKDAYGVAPAPETRWLGRRIRARRDGESSETPAFLRALLRPTRQGEPVDGGPLGEAAPARRPSRFGWGAGILGVGVLCLLFWVAGRGGRNANREGSAGPPPNATIVAVLPFRDFGDSADARVAQAFVEDVTLHLERMAPPAVRSTMREALPPEASTNLEALGAQLGVTHMVDGSVRHLGNHLRITVRLVRGHDGVTLWAQSFDTVGGDPGGEQGLAQLVADSLRDYLMKADP